MNIRLGINDAGIIRAAGLRIAVDGIGRAVGANVMGAAVDSLGNDALIDHVADYADIPVYHLSGWYDSWTGQVADQTYE